MVENAVLLAWRRVVISILIQYKNSSILGIMKMSTKIAKIKMPRNDCQ